MAQSRGTETEQPADAATANGTGANAPRSAFGRVMGIMIEALRRQKAVRATPAGGASPGIEVGSAFRLDDAGPAPKNREPTPEPPALASPLAVQDLP